MTILDHIPTDLRQTASTRGGEWHGPCPFCGGKDRFRAQPEHDFAACRQCGWTGDSIQVLRDVDGLSFQMAAEQVGRPLDRGPRAPLKQTLNRTLTEPPPKAWQQRAREHAERCRDRLWSDAGQRALLYLHRRGLEERTIEAASLGYNPEDVFEPPAAWGLEGGRRIFLPRGITIPWIIDGDVWDVRLRRPLPKGSDEPKYLSPRGRGNGLYLGDQIVSGAPVLLCEGELDAWSAAQAGEGLVIPVATGSTSGARRVRWQARLRAASVVLVAFDAEDSGEKAVRYWTGSLPNAVRWRPYWGDVSEMLQDGADVRAWMMAGLSMNPCVEEMR